MATKKNVKAVDYNDAEAIMNYCENDVAVCEACLTYDDWKVRLKQEYVELKNKFEKLRKYNTKDRVETGSSVLVYDPCNREKEYRARLMNEQEEVMFRYLGILEERMTLEGIDY